MRIFIHICKTDISDFDGKWADISCNLLPYSTKHEISEKKYAKQG